VPVRPQPRKRCVGGNRPRHGEYVPNTGHQPTPRPLGQVYSEKIGASADVAAPVLHGWDFSLGFLRHPNLDWRLIQPAPSRRGSGYIPKADDAPHLLGERGTWQRRFREHAIRDRRDFDAHLDYIHFNTVKHGWMSRVADWPPSSFHRTVRSGWYPLEWAARWNGPWSDGPDPERRVRRRAQIT